MPNIQLNYLYRDSCNYKNYGWVVFSNQDHLSLSEINQLIQFKLIDEIYFYASSWDIPNLFFESVQIENDPTWHEFDYVEYTNKEPAGDISYFLRYIR